jgi:hypothetical protein
MLALVILLYFWYRRRVRALAAKNATPAGPKEVPAQATDVLNRPDPNEKAIELAQAEEARNAFYHHQAAYNDHEAQHAAHAEHEGVRPPFVPRISNPFADAQSIQTMSTGQSTNVIPIALIPRTPGGTVVPPAAGANGATPPVPSPLHAALNLEHLNVSKDSMQPQSAGDSSRSGARNSVMSGMTTATDLLNEAPMIVTQNRQVVDVSGVAGVSRPEVIRATPSQPSTPMTSDSTRAHPPSTAGRPSMRSPLAATSFGPSDVVPESDEGHTDPFHDKHSAGLRPEDNHGRDRPTSMATMATGVGTIIADISSARIVQVGLTPALSNKSSFVSVPRSTHRMTAGKLISPSSQTSPPSSGPVGTLQQQQARALAIAQAKALEQGGADLNRRVSASSVLSSSTRADSILESFPFVPPSPISDRPARTPPRSPLGQSFGDEAPRPADARMLAPSAAAARPGPRMSTASEFSTVSNGLGAYTFQVADDAPPTPAPPSAFSSAPTQSVRASLDTLALTSALSSYPLGFDQEEANAHYPLSKGP